MVVVDDDAIALTNSVALSLAMVACRGSSRSG
jgi:hypothetical protein